MNRPLKRPVVGWRIDIRVAPFAVVSFKNAIVVPRMEHIILAIVTGIRVDDCYVIGITDHGLSPLQRLR